MARGLGERAAEQKYTALLPVWILRCEEIQKLRSGQMQDHHGDPEEGGHFTLAHGEEMRLSMAQWKREGETGCEEGLRVW